MLYSAFEHEDEGAEGVFHWQQMYLIDEKDAASIREGNKDRDSRMVWYELMSPQVQLDALMEVAASLAPYTTLEEME